MVVKHSVIKSYVKPRSNFSNWHSVSEVSRVNISNFHLGSGQIGDVYAGRLVFSNGDVKRVAIKKFKYDAQKMKAQHYSKVIELLAKSGVNIPKTFVYNLDGEPVLISPLFGSIKKGSKLIANCPNLSLLTSFPEFESLTTILANTLNAGLYPHSDYIFSFKNSGENRFIPMELDNLVDDYYYKRSLKSVFRRNTFFTDYLFDVEKYKSLSIEEKNSLIDKSNIFINLLLKKIKDASLRIYLETKYKEFLQSI